MVSWLWIQDRFKQIRSWFNLFRITNFGRRLIGLNSPFYWKWSVQAILIDKSFPIGRTRIFWTRFLLEKVSCQKWLNMYFPFNINLYKTDNQLWNGMQEKTSQFLSKHFLFQRSILYFNHLFTWKSSLNPYLHQKWAHLKDQFQLIMTILMNWMSLMDPFLIRIKMNQIKISKNQTKFFGLTYLSNANGHLSYNVSC